MRFLRVSLVAASIAVVFDLDEVHGASGQAAFRDFNQVDPADTVCKPSVDFRVAGVDGFVVAIKGLSDSGGERIQCGTCLRVKNAKTEVSTVVRVVDATGSDRADATMELSMDAFATIAALDDRSVDVKFKVVPCEEQGSGGVVADSVDATASKNETRLATHSGEEENHGTPHHGDHFQKNKNTHLGKPPHHQSGMPKHKKNRQHQQMQAAHRHDKQAHGKKTKKNEGKSAHGKPTHGKPHKKEPQPPPHSADAQSGEKRRH